MRACLCLVAAGALYPTVAAAQNHDLQQWTLLSAQGSISDRIVLYAEVQPRFTDDVSRLGQLLIRPAIGYQIDKDVTAFLGYAYVRTELLGQRPTDEHRIFQQLNFPIYRGAGDFTVTARTRLEQRTVVNADGLGWRLRQQVRAEAPVRAGGTLRAIAWTEPFYNFNTTDWGQRRGFDQWRTFIGLGIPVFKGLVAEPGYMNQTVFLRGEDRVNHIMSLTMTYRW